MISKILAVGDSFTYGEELLDRSKSWPQLVADNLGASLDNKAAPGTGNTRIVRNLVESAANELDLVLIGWSSAGRIEFADDEGIFDTWPGYSGRMFSTHHNWRNALIEYVSCFHSPEYLYKQFLINVILAQNFLESKKIRYLMINTVNNEFYRNQYANKFTDLESQINRSSFVGWGKFGMVELADKFPKGPNGHFLDTGHEVVANVITAAVKQKGWDKWQ